MYIWNYFSEHVLKIVQLRSNFIHHLLRNFESRAILIAINKNQILLVSLRSCNKPWESVTSSFASAAVLRFILYNKISIWLLRTVARNSWGNDAFRKEIDICIYVYIPSFSTNGHSVSNTTGYAIMRLCTHVEKLAFAGHSATLERLDFWHGRSLWYLRVQSDRNRSGFPLVEKSPGRRRRRGEGDLSDTCKWKSLAFTGLGLLSKGRWGGNKYHSNVLSTAI